MYKVNQGGPGASTTDSEKNFKIVYFFVWCFILDKYSMFKT